MKKLLIILALFVMTIAACKKDPIHHYYWGQNESCYYMLEDSTKVYVDKKFCACQCK